MCTDRTHRTLCILYLIPCVQRPVFILVTNIVYFLSNYLYLST